MYPHLPTDTLSLWPTQVCPPPPKKRHRSAILAGLSRDQQTDRETDRQRNRPIMLCTDVSSNSPHLALLVMWTKMAKCNGKR